MDISEKIKYIAETIKSSKYLVALTGAGVSTLSGIPDFRTDKSGIWDRYDQSKIFNIDYFKKNPREFYKFAKECIFTIKNCKPGIAHQLLAHLEDIGYLKSIATQNIDGLHQSAGSKKVFELHGSPINAHCLTCQKIFTQDDVENKLNHSDVPYCDDCNGIIKPDIVFYGEMLPIQAINNSFSEAEKCDMMLVLGTSLVVFPAAYLPEIAIKKKAKVIILTKQPTPIDELAELVINDELTLICSELMKYF